MIGVFIFITKYSLGLKIQKTEVMNIVQSYCRKFVEFWTTEGYERGRGGKRIMKQKGKERNRRPRSLSACAALGPMAPALFPQSSIPA